MGAVWRRHHRRGRPRRQPLRVQIRISNSLVAAKRVPRRGRRPDVASNSALGKRRGRRECRVMASPMARLQQKKQAAVTTGSARSTGIPCAMVYGLYRALPGAPGFLATITSVMQSIIANLASASGCQDHTTSPSVPAAVVCCRLHVHRIPAPRVVTIGRNVPLHRGGMAESIVVICPTEQA